MARTKTSYFVVIRQGRPESRRYNDDTPATIETSIAKFDDVNEAVKLAWTLIGNDFATNQLDEYEDLLNGDWFDSKLAPYGVNQQVRIKTVSAPKKE